MVIHLFALLLLLFLAAISNGSIWQQSDNDDSGNSDHVITIDLAPAMARFDRAELIARVSSLHDRAVVCQTYLAERSPDDGDTVFECVLTKSNVDFQPGYNFFSFELVSAVTGKRYARRLISGVYHPDTVLLDGDGGHAGVNATAAATAQVVAGSALAVALKVGVDWALDRFAHIIDRPPPPPPAIVRTRIYGEGDWRPPPPPPSPPPSPPAAAAAAAGTRSRRQRPAPPPPTALVPYRVPWRVRAAACLAQVAAWTTTPAHVAAAGAVGGLAWAAWVAGPAAVALLQAVPQSAAVAGSRARALAAALLATQAQRREQRRLRRDGHAEEEKRRPGRRKEQEAGRERGRVEEQATYYTTVFGDKVPLWSGVDVTQPPPTSSFSASSPASSPPPLLPPQPQPTQEPMPSARNDPPPVPATARGGRTLPGPREALSRALRSLLADAPALGKPRCPLRNLIPVESSSSIEFESS